jgi:ubiquinone/menaquinone biosynthesis C-methylase UbiE
MNTNTASVIDKIFNECESYIYENEDEDQDIINSIDEVNKSKFVWGTTPFVTFNHIISKVNKPKRFIVFGCSVGYMCFFWNKIYPDVKSIGIDLHYGRVNFAKEIQNKYSIDNVEFIVDDVNKFQVQDGDLIWQNNLLFDDFENLSLNVFSKFEVQIISYKKLFHTYRIDNCLFNNSNPIKFSEDEFTAKTSWTKNQNFYLYKRSNKEYHQVLRVEDLDIKIGEKCLDSYFSMNYFKYNIVSERLKYLYNKNNIKQEFIKAGFNVPTTLFYSKEECSIMDIINNEDPMVCKAAHLSESDYVFLKKNRKDIVKIQNDLNYSLTLNARSKEPLMLKECERGILIEEFIDIIYELKVFVIFGYPFIADLRRGSKEIDRVDFITLENDFINWDKEFELIKKFSKEINIDFYRIDFLFDGVNLYASECAFMPSTILPINIESMILDKWRSPYFQYYYPTMYKD